MNTTQEITFAPASKTEAKLRLAIIGPSGAGKTYSALAVATNLGKRIAVIDTERGSASKYADQFRFDTWQLTDYNPGNYVRALRAAVAAGYDVVVIDSMSHAWNGKGGALEMVDDAARRSKGNSFGAWRDVTPLHQSLMDEIVGAKTHVIATMRSKTEWSQERDEKGRTVIRKIGTAPIQRDGVEYEFDVVVDLDQDHVGVVTKTRCSDLSGVTIPKPGKQLADTLSRWLAGTSTEAAPKVVEASPDAQSPKGKPKAAPAKDSSASEILDGMQNAKSLLELNAWAKKGSILPDEVKAEARQVYARRRKELDARAKQIAEIVEATTDKQHRQEWIEYLGSQGIVEVDPASMTDSELKLAHEWIQQQNPVV